MIFDIFSSYRARTIPDSLEIRKELLSPSMLFHTEDIISLFYKYCKGFLQIANCKLQVSELRCDYILRRKTNYRRCLACLAREFIGRFAGQAVPPTATQFILILLQQNISNKSFDLYIELRSNISSLSWDEHIDCRYMLCTRYIFCEQNNGTFHHLRK